jgi:cytochrome P450
MPYIREMEPIMDSRYAILRRQLDHFAASGETFDLREYITYCIVDILGELAFGEALGNQEAEDPKQIPPVSEALYASCIAGAAPWAAPLLSKLAPLFIAAKVKSLLTARKRLLDLAAKNIKARSEKSDYDRKDILGIILSLTKEKAGSTQETRQTVVDAFTLIFGGTHTTGNTLHCLFANLARHPEHLRRFVAELDERLAPLAPDQAAYSMTGLDEKLDFVNACVKENFRKDPVGTFNMPRTVPREGAVVDGFAVPGGVSQPLCLWLTLYR